MRTRLDPPKKPLYRKVNTRARNVHHGPGGDFRHERNTKRDRGPLPKRGTMRSNPRQGLDYTPLFKFLLSKVGEDWDAVFSEAVARLDKQEPIFWMVALLESEHQDYVRIGESSYYSGLYVDKENRLAIVAPQIGQDSLEPRCGCCTHSYNGVPFTKRFA